MSIKILAGELKGMGIAVPSSDQLRPTSIMLRKKIFDASQGLDIRWFVDLLAGSGSVGLEAVSRGA